MDDSIRRWAASVGVTGRYTTAPKSRAVRIPLVLADGALAIFSLAPFLPRSFISQLQALGLPPSTIRAVAQRIRARSDWGPAWEWAAQWHEQRGQEHRQAGRMAAARLEFVAAFASARLQVKGDGRLFFTPYADRLPGAAGRRRLYDLVLATEPGCVERVQIPYRSQVTGTSESAGHLDSLDSALHGLLHWLPDPGAINSPDRRPGLVLLHGLTGEKEALDLAGGSFRQAGFVTLAIDLPAHGESGYGPRLRPDEDAGLMRAVDVLAHHPKVDPGRIAVAGGSFGGYSALRLAAADRRIRAVVAVASPYRGAEYFHHPGREDVWINFSHLVGAYSPAEAIAWAEQFTLSGRLELICCPVFLGYGTRDRLVPFTEGYRVSRELRCPTTFKAFLGAGHEVADLTGEVSELVLPWLRRQVADPLG